MRGNLKITMMDEHYTFHVGERVQIKEWTEMAEEYKELNNEKPSHLSSYINLPEEIPFSFLMQHLCGKEATITGISPNGTIYLEDINTTGRTNWFYTLSMIRPLDIPSNTATKLNWEEVFYNAIN